MTNPGTSLFVQDGARSSKSLQVLDRIANVLDVPISEFYRHDAEGFDAAAPSTAECELILKASLRVGDPDLRHRIVDMMRAYLDD